MSRIYIAHVSTEVLKALPTLPLVIGNLSGPTLYSARSKLFSPDTPYRDTVCHVIVSPGGHPI